ncbi:MAG: AI-2E family transporter [Bryobacteraceae bacterium]|jgi:predicted PurR-regulated permease PerM/methylmalonyl-CoA mutase cobalamin-binding subunit
MTLTRFSRLPPSSQFVPVIATIVTIAALYFARNVLIPLALAALLSFLLAPLAKRLEMWRLGRLPAVLIVMTISFCLIGGIGWVVSNQLIDVINDLPNYRENIQRKLQSIHGPRGGSLAKATDNVQELTKELSTTAPNQPAPVSRQPAKSTKAAPPLQSGVHPVPVELVEPPASALQSLRNVLGPLVAPLGTAAIVIVFTIFMLMKREDLRNRLFRLAGQRQLNVMTQALDDAAQRVSRYLLMQFIVNASYGVLIAIGLYFIGVPNALLWGVLAGSLRFIPYAGPLIGCSLPLILALAAFDGWTRPVLTLCLFLVTELILSNLVEPWLYGAHTGISSLAILVAAVFWTVLWGPVGLILSTPLTVCLLVLGRYVPQLSFLNIVLGDEPVLVREAQFYQRLLAMDQREAQTVIDAFLEQGQLVDLYDEVVIPALSMAEHDRHQGALDQTKETFIFQSINEFIVELAGYRAEQPEASPTNGDGPRQKQSDPAIGTLGSNGSNVRVVCFPAKDDADEITGAMLAQLLEQAGYAALSFSVADSPVAVLQDLSNHAGDIVCICALPPFALMNARTLSRRLRARFPDLKIVVGLWNFSDGGANYQERLGNAFANTVVTTLKQALEHIHSLTDSNALREDDPQAIVAAAKEL